MAYSDVSFPVTDCRHAIVGGAVGSWPQLATYEPSGVMSSTQIWFLAQNVEVLEGHEIISRGTLKLQNLPAGNPLQNWRNVGARNGKVNLLERER